MANTYFCCYDSYFECFEQLSDAEVGRLIRACMDYHMNGQAAELVGNERFLFPIFKSQIDRDNEKYKTKCKKLSENAKKRIRSNTPDETDENCNCEQMDAIACKSSQGEREREGKGERESERESDSEREKESKGEGKRADALSLLSAPCARECESCSTDFLPRFVEQVVDKMNRAWHVRYSADNPAVASAIANRWRNGADMRAFEYVIETAAALWGKDPKMINALNPATVFNDKNFSRFENSLAPDDAAIILRAT